MTLINKLPKAQQELWEPLKSDEFCGWVLAKKEFKTPTVLIHFEDGKPFVTTYKAEAQELADKLNGVK